MLLMVGDLKRVYLQKIIDPTGGGGGGGPDPLIGLKKDFRVRKYISRFLD